MHTFYSLQAQGLPDSFDATVHGEAPIVEVLELDHQIQINYTFPGFYVSDDPRLVDGSDVPFNQVNIAATGFLAEGGRPLLPSFGRFVQIPAGCNYRVRVEKGESVTFDDLLILPAQEHLADQLDVEEAFEYDTALYERDKLYPKDLVEVTGPHHIDDYVALLVHVRPLQYNPKRRRLHGYGNLRVIIDLKDRPMRVDEPPENPGPGREAFGNLVLNPSRSGLRERLEFAPLPPTSHLLLRGPDLLIIYHPELKGAADKLALWKQTRGLRVELVPISAIGNTSAALKKYIRDRRKGFSRLRYVMLFGDVDMIVPETIPTSPWGSNITDYYYSTPSDPSSPTSIVTPWLSIGRIPIRTLKDANKVISKIIAYEKSPPAIGDYFWRMAFAGFLQNSDNNPVRTDRGYVQALESIRKALMMLGFNVERIYVSDTPKPTHYVDGTQIPLTCYPR
jgi:hypothetical protein